ncbi:hypothetical protein BJ322DRAFT_1213540 [Thelephora terrestris]|uniref:F-box domain-containing protein n=1 Tax=Thelephora terrestris TaxID=56493 RepID=A0A9P6H8Q2_9AGAM|nr:hypothetical protein BJ322DRAFT_1213540 [Thelephora terrestris]
MMLPFLPPEILDLIVDHLHNEPTVLKACCVVSKSWIPRSRRYIFARVKLDSIRSIESWAKAFPDPFDSPAYYTRNFWVHGLGVVSADVLPWIRSFGQVEELTMNMFGSRGVSLTQLHGFTLTLKSLHLTRVCATVSEIITLICSVPLLEDLSLSSKARDIRADGPWATPLVPPKLTGSLLLHGESRSIARGLSELLDGPHFSTIGVRCNAEDIDSETITDLVSKCSESLETLYLGYYTLSVSFLALQLINFLPSRVDLDYVEPPAVDLSNATKLKHLEFQWRGPDIQWITTAIQTAQFKTLLQITIFMSSIRPISPRRKFLGWHELDHLMVQLWTSHSILPKILYCNGPQELVASLLPELTKRGFVHGQEGNHNVWLSLLAPPLSLVTPVAARAFDDVNIGITTMNIEIPFASRSCL